MHPPQSTGSTQSEENQAQKEEVTCLFGNNADPLVTEATPCQHPNVLRLQIFSLYKHNPPVSPEWGSWSRAGLDNRKRLRRRKPEASANTRHKAEAGAQHLPM